jgi:carbonic anhydrase/acetyltransferase-like protein (isoleucine patch superfamily)
VTGRRSKAASLTGEERFLSTRLQLDPTAWVAPGAVLTGEVRLGREASIWYGCVVRGDLEPIELGARTNLQDLSVVHVDRGFPVRVGAGVTIGHRAVIHGCTIEDGALIGMGAVLLSGCRVGRDALVAAGAVVREGFEVPSLAIAAGVPAKVIGRVSDEQRQRITEGVATYVACAAAHRREPGGASPPRGETGSDRSGR